VSPAHVCFDMMLTTQLPSPSCECEFECLTEVDRQLIYLALQCWMRVQDCVLMCACRGVYMCADRSRSRPECWICAAIMRLGQVCVSVSSWPMVSNTSLRCYALPQ
jgi:hypothetical protein